MNDAALKNKPLLSLLAVLLFLGAFETLARVFDRSSDVCPLRYMRFANDRDFGISEGKIKQGNFLVRDPVLFWRLNPRGHGFNSSGFRGKEVPLKKPKGVSRIFCIGDSCTFGVEAAEQAVFPALLEKYFNESGINSKFEVINAGVPGYSSWQGLQLLKHELVRFSPDILVVYFGWNDVLPALYYRDKQQKAPDSRIIFIQDLLSRSRLYRFLERMFVRLQGFSYSRNDVCPKKESSARRVPPDDYKDNLKSMAKLMRQRGGDILFLSLVCRDKDSLQQSIAEEHNGYIREVAAGLNIEVVDLEPAFKAGPGRDFFWDDIHFNSLGHRMAAEEIYKALKDKTRMEAKK